MHYIGGVSPAERGEAMTNPLYPPVEVVNAAHNLSKFDEFTVPDLGKNLADARSTYFLHPNFAHELGLDDHMVESLHFAVREDWAAGREDSSQGVFFGEADIRVDDGELHTVPLAVKPYFTARRQLIHEYVALDHFRNEPGLRSFEPLGIWVDESGYSYLLTRFEESVVSLDNIQWNKDGDDPLKEHYSLFGALQKSAQILARLHIRGYAHQDAQIKNMAIDVETDTVRLIDLTTLVKIHEVEEPDEVAWERAVLDDLRTLVSSVGRRGYLRGETTKDARNMVNMALLAIHASMLRHPSSSPTLFPAAARVVSSIDSMILDEIS